MKNLSPKRNLLIILISISVAAAFISAFITAMNISKNDSQKTGSELILSLPSDFLTTAIQTDTDISSINKKQDQDGFLYSSNKNGTCSLVGVSDKSQTELIIPEKNPLGETVIKIDSNAFKGCNNTASITIPSTVKEIAPGAFIECGNLIAIMTSSFNTRFCSVGGVLFSKDKTVLVCYPANRVGNDYLLSINVKKIEAYAFYNILNLENIFYAESAEKFTSIHIGAGNGAFSALPITCNYTPAKK